MSTYAVTIDDKALREQMSKILDTIFIQEFNSKYSSTGDVIVSAVKELVYSRKDEIIDKVVDRAVKEIVRKGLPKLLEKVDTNLD